MVGGATPNDLWMSLQPTTAISLDLFQLVKRSEYPVGQRLIGEGP